MATIRERSHSVEAARALAQELAERHDRAIYVLSRFSRGLGVSQYLVTDVRLQPGWGYFCTVISQAMLDDMR